MIESLENDTYVIETNMTEMDTNINMFTASSNMSYEPASDDELDSAFADGQTPAPQSTGADADTQDTEDVDVYGERGHKKDEDEGYSSDDDDDDDDDFDDFLDE